MRLQKIDVTTTGNDFTETFTVSFPAGTLVNTGKSEPYVCGCGKKDWCDHVEQVILQGMDAPLNGLVVVGQPIMVPLVPSMGVWQPVLVRRVIRDRFTISPAVPHEGMGLDSEDSGRPELQGVFGVISPEEGRGTIRTIVTTWIEQFKEGLNCRASSHTFKAVRAYDSAASSNNTRWLMANRWSQLWYGRCWTCHKQLMDMMNDLVPDASGPGSRSF